MQPCDDSQDCILRRGIDEAVKLILSENNTLFQSITAKLIYIIRNCGHRNRSEGLFHYYAHEDSFNALLKPGTNWLFRSHRTYSAFC